jgi:hypothetical protein
MEKPKVEMKKEVKQVVEKIPEKLLGDITDKQKKRGQLLNQMLQTSVQVIAGQERQQEILKKMKNNDQSLGDRIKNAYNKMKLKRKAQYNWRYNGKDSFVGTEIPPKRVKDDTKK